MKKKYLLRFAIVLLTLVFLPEPTFADVIQQKDTVTGLVIGKNKEPLPGAKVEIVGQSYSAFTDIDGRFNIKCEPGAKKVLVSYPKARAIKKKISPDMTVQIGRTWRQVPEKYQWFVGANIGYGITCADFKLRSTLIESPDNSFDSYWENQYFTDDFISPTISVMAGRVKVVGWYVKAFVNPSVGQAWYEDSWDGYEKYDARCSNAGMILGGMVRLGCPLHLYLGGGFSHANISGLPNAQYSHYAWQFDMGLLFRIKDNFGINWSLNVGESKNADIFYASYTNIGFCYFFNK